jgi:2-oxoisovalerate dehydrogenase E1 component
MPALSKEDKLRLLTTMLESRHADLREQNLNRQGKGHFHVSGMGPGGWRRAGGAMSGCSFSC